MEARPNHLSFPTSMTHLKGEILTSMTQGAGKILTKDDPPLVSS